MPGTAVALQSISIPGFQWEFCAQTKYPYFGTGIGPISNFIHSLMRSLRYQQVCLYLSVHDEAPLTRNVSFQIVSMSRKKQTVLTVHGSAFSGPLETAQIRHLSMAPLI